MLGCINPSSNPSSMHFLNVLHESSNGRRQGPPSVASGQAPGQKDSALGQFSRLSAPLRGKSGDKRHRRGSTEVSRPPSPSAVLTVGFRRRAFGFRRFGSHSELPHFEIFTMFESSKSAILRAQSKVTDRSPTPFMHAELASPTLFIHASQPHPNLS